MSDNPVLDVVEAARRVRLMTVEMAADHQGELGAAWSALDTALDAYDQVEKPYHVVKIDHTSWFVMHPLSCRPNLFECGATYHPDRELVPGMWRLELVGDEWELVERL